VIEACLDGLRAQTFRDFDAIVVNSSDDERTGELVRGGFPEVRFEQSPVRLYPHAARNRGVELAEGELLVFTDPDTRAWPDWLERLVGAAAEGHELVVGATVLGGASWFECGVHLCKFSSVLGASPPGRRAVAATANALCTRRLWDAVGPFEEAFFAGDAVLSWRATRAGHPPWFEPRAVVEHRHGENVGSLWRERLHRGADFTTARAAYERWSRARLAARLPASPAVALLMLGRTARDAARCGCFGAFLSTLPLQVVADVGWALGETRALARMLGAGDERPSWSRSLSRQ
jgi:GT2 family glycosyltransferase